jgi:uncharacterized protein Yka (UPF0111/DUF47 family)
MIPNTLHIIYIENNKLKEMYKILEGALDRCAGVADVIEDIALKYGNG